MENQFPQWLHFVPSLPGPPILPALLLKKLLIIEFQLFLTIESNLQAQVLLARQLPPLQVVLVYDVLCAILYLTTGFNFFSMTS